MNNSTKFTGVNYDDFNTDLTLSSSGQLDLNLKSDLDPLDKQKGFVIDILTSCMMAQESYDPYLICYRMTLSESLKFNSLSENNLCDTITSDLGCIDNDIDKIILIREKTKCISEGVI